MSRIYELGHNRVVCLSSSSKFVAVLAAMAGLATVGDSARHFSLGFEQEFDTALREQMRGVSDPYER